MNRNGTHDAVMEQKVAAVVDYIIEYGTKNTSGGNWIMGFDDIPNEIADLSFIQSNAERINDGLWEREEILDTDITDEGFDMVYGLAFCPNLDSYTEEMLETSQLDSLHEWLDRYYTYSTNAFCEHIRNPSISQAEMVELAVKMTQIDCTYNYLKNEYEFEADEVDSLFKLQYPLDVIAANWWRISVYRDTYEVLKELFEKIDDLPDEPLIPYTGKLLLNNTKDDAAAFVKSNDNMHAVDEDEAVPRPSLMSIERFWSILDDAREAGGSWKHMLKPLCDALAKLTANEIFLWDNYFDEYFLLADKGKIIAAAMYINDGISDDGFDYFCGWLIAQGKDVYLNTLHDPDSLSKSKAVQDYLAEASASEFVPEAGYENRLRFESIIYAPAMAYEQKLGANAQYYDDFHKSPFSDEDAAAIKAEIRYAKDIDTLPESYEPLYEWLDGLGALFPELKAIKEIQNQQCLEETTPIVKASILSRLQPSEKVAHTTEQPQNKTKHNKGIEV
jgi:hypothetical protein